MGNVGKKGFFFAMLVRNWMLGGPWQANHKRSFNF
jgi:hypothetical protein